MTRLLMPEGCNNRSCWLKVVTICKQQHWQVKVKVTSLWLQFRISNCLVKMNIHVQCDSLTILVYKLWPRLQFLKVRQASRSRSQVQIWNDVCILVTRIWLHMWNMNVPYLFWRPMFTFVMACHVTSNSSKMRLTKHNSEIQDINIGVTWPVCSVCQ